jgi:hypothetical protein
MIDYMPSDFYPVGLAIGTVLLIFGFGRWAQRNESLSMLIMRIMGVAP